MFFSPFDALISVFKKHIWNFFLKLCNNACEASTNICRKIFLVYTWDRKSLLLAWTLTSLTCFWHSTNFQRKQFSFSSDILAQNSVASCYCWYLVTMSRKKYWKQYKTKNWWKMRLQRNVRPQSRLWWLCSADNIRLLIRAVSIEKAY